MAGQTAPCQAAEKVSRMSFRAQRGIPLRLKSQEKEGFLTPQTPFGMTDTEFFSSLLGISCAPNPLSFLYAHSRCVFAARMKRKAAARRFTALSLNRTARRKSPT